MEKFYFWIYLVGRLPPPNSDRLKVPYTHRNKGFLDHKHKFPLALDDKDLSKACKVLRKDLKKGDFCELDFVMGLSADFDARLSIFYADFNENDNYHSVKQPTKVERPILQEAVDKFLKFMKAQNTLRGIYDTSPSPTFTSEG